MWHRCQEYLRKKMSPWQQLCLQAKLRQLVMLSSAAVFLVWVMANFYLFFTNDCGGQQYTTFLCDQYRRGIVSGSLCPRLCDKPILRSVHLQHCIHSGQDYIGFYWRDVHNGGHHDLQIKVSAVQMEYAKHHDRTTAPYSQPEKGTSMDQFKQMVTQVFEEKIGKGFYRNIISKVMDVADVNHDQKVSLAEAKTIWALLQNNEFFIAFVFSDSDYVPQLKGFCGEAYALDYHPRDYLYKKKKDSYLAMIFPHHYTWSFPPWEHRAKIMVGLLEFALEVYQHGAEDRFYLCNSHEENIGYNNQHDVRISDISKITAKQEIETYLSDIQCSVNSDCIYTRQCQAVCDKVSSKCTGELTHPSLRHVCTIINEYLFKNIPLKVKSELVSLLERCHKLDSTMEMEHSLIVNDLKSLLWKQISYNRGG